MYIVDPTIASIDLAIKGSRIYRGISLPTMQHSCQITPHPRLLSLSTSARPPMLLSLKYYFSRSVIIPVLKRENKTIKG